MVGHRWTGKGLRRTLFYVTHTAIASLSVKMIQRIWWLVVRLDRLVVRFRSSSMYNVLVFMLNEQSRMLLLVDQRSAGSYKAARQSHGPTFLPRHVLNDFEPVLHVAEMLLKPHGAMIASRWQSSPRIWDMKSTSFRSTRKYGATALRRTRAGAIQSMVLSSVVAAT